MSHIVEACCNRPPALSLEYKPVGKYTEINGLNTYVVGPANATKGVLFIYDAFGWTHQVFTAADTMAGLMPDTLILTPDFFKGEPVHPSDMQKSEKERGEIIAKFLSGPADPIKNQAAAEGIIAQAKDAGYDKVKKWGAFGLCWGGKMTARLSQSGTPLAVAGTGHPGRPDAAEAASMVIPYICLLSPEDGPLEARQAYEKALSDNKHETYVETYEDSVHGWMGARADFGKEKDRVEFDRAYKKAAEFMTKHLS